MIAVGCVLIGHWIGSGIERAFSPRLIQLICLLFCLHVIAFCKMIAQVPPLWSRAVVARCGRAPFQCYNIRFVISQQQKLRFLMHLIFYHQYLLFIRATNRYLCKWKRCSCIFVAFNARDRCAGNLGWFQLQPTSSELRTVGTWIILEIAYLAIDQW